MKTKIQKSNSSEMVTAEPSADFVTRALEHPQAKAAAPNGRTGLKAKFYIMLGASLMEEEIYSRHRQAAPERMFGLAFLGRLFGNHPPSVTINSVPQGQDEQPKSFWSRLRPTSLLPAVTLLMLALAAWQTGETKSYKSAVEGNEKVVKVLEKQLAIAQQKNDDLQGELNDTIKAAADFTTLKDSLTKLMNKYKNQNAAKSEVAQNTKPSGNGTSQ